jgi:hypothetical protein
MSIRKIQKSFAPVTKEVKYLNKTFPEFRQNLIEFAKTYFPDSYNDFNEASPGMMMIEMASYVGDVLSYYIDTQFRENLIQYAEEQDNIISIAQALGYRVKPSTAAYTDLDIFQICPATGITTDYIPDEKYYLRVDAGALFSAPEYDGTTFRSVDIVDFSDPTEREITVYAVDANNKPLTYLIRKKVKVVAGTVKTYDYSFGSAQRFSKFKLPDENVLEIIDVVDAAGNKWYQVDYLAQDLVFDASLNSSAYTGSDEGIPPSYVLRAKRVPRRFVLRYNEDYEAELNFGSGILDETSTLINLDPRKIANSEYEDTLASTTIDPADFLSSKSYGLSPSNTTMTVTYTVGGGLESNVPSNTITDIADISILNNPLGFSAQERALYNDVVASVAVNNPDPAVGGKGQDSVEEIRQNALAFFNAQNRLVTPEDYLVRSYAMPGKFGGVAKVFVAPDEQINNILRNTNQEAPVGGVFADNPAAPNVVNLYVLGYNKDKKVTRLNRDVKHNLKRYLDVYRILTDEIRILDGFVVNIGVKFRVVVFKNYNMNEVIARSIDAVKTFFEIDRWQMNQPIILNDLYTEIALVEGVQSVTSVEVFNRYSFKDGSDYENFIYDIPSATVDGIIYPSLDPCLFELRYPDTDIIASAIQ